jgi:hypothetical protein
MSQSPESSSRTLSELISQLKNVVELLRELEPVCVELNADEFDTLGAFVEMQRALPDGGYPKDRRYRVDSEWMDYRPDAGSRLYQQRYYYDSREYCIYSLGYQGGWTVERCW